MIASLLLAGAVATAQPAKADVSAAAPATSWRCARTPQDAPEKCIEDFEGIDAAIHGVYEVISGPPGQKRDFDRMRSLFAPGATLKAIGPKGLRGGSLEDYISRNKDVLERDGFTERELGRRVEVWGGLATAWSSYDGRTANGSFHERGINSFQLVKIDGKWLVASILWQEETPDNPLPADLVRKK